MPRTATIWRAKDVAHILDCCPEDVLELAKKVELAGEKRGRFWFFRLKDVRAYQRKQARREAVKAARL